VLFALFLSLYDAMYVCSVHCHCLSLSLSSCNRVVANVVSSSESHSPVARP